MQFQLSNTLPDYPKFVEGIRRAPDRGYTLTPAQTETALKNALRYIPEELHEKLAPEFMEELVTRGRIYGYRFRPEGDLKAKPIDQYKGKCIEGKAFQVMIDNNLCFDIALYPYELVTYGETGQVCQNWMQYRLIKMYLEELTQDQTLVVESGHPLGLFKSRPEAPRVIITNAMMVGMFDNQKDWHEAMQMGVANYGQMTAGGWMYIGPQGIVHGTFNTILNAGRKKLGIAQDKDLRGYLFVSSGLGGMSGAQPKAGVIAGAASIIAEVDSSRIETRHSQGWVQHVTQDMKEAFDIAKKAMDAKEPISIAYHGNIVDLLEYADKNDIHIHLLSDQTSCHAVYDGGYCPAGITFEERTDLLAHDRDKFCALVDASLKRHFEVIKRLVAKGTYFFDYGNSFMKAIYDAGVKEISRNGIDEKDGFIWPSYVEDIMGPELFDYGYGPFRWVCLSGKHEDLIKTDHAAMSCIDPTRRGQDMDNYIWIRDAEKNNLGRDYPDDVSYNAACTGKHFIHNLAFTAPRLLDAAKTAGMTLIDVRQGYSKCSIVIVDETSLITYDEGIVKACSAYPELEVLKVSPGFVRLDGFDTGFIGGASGRIGNEIIFNGDLFRHPDFERIVEFIESRGLKCRWFSEYPLTDIGSIL